MTKEEKDSKSGWSEMGGYLKTFSYEEAWKNFWDNASQKERNQILDIPQFDTEIFKKITGLDISKATSLKGKKVKVELDGQSYEAIIQ